MEALSLVLPAATIASTGSNGTDAGALDARTDAAPADFAALLAAGLLPQQDLNGLLSGQQAAGQVTELAVENEATQALTDAAAQAGAPLQSALHAAVIAQAPHVLRDAAPEDVSAPVTETLMTAQGGGKTGAALAAAPATIAASAAGDPLTFAAEAQASALDAALSSETALAAPAEAAATPAHPLHTAAPERLPASQPTAVLEVAAPVHEPQFAQALSQQVVWMADKDAQVAELRINPPELGPVEVRLELSGDEATVQFASAHAEVRNAIESAIARLRESMAQAGIQLGEASVSAESFREQTADQFARGNDRDGYRGNREHAEPSWQAAPLPVETRRGLVDLFA